MSVLFRIYFVMSRG